MNPRARSDGLVVEELPEETLVYDLQRHQAHCLNRTAALIWRRCDGRSSAPAIAGSLARELGVPADPGLVHHALVRLQKAHLLAAPIELPAVPSRRQLLRRMGVSVLVPAVLSIAAPHAWAQTTICPVVGNECANFPDCTPCAPTANKPCSKVCKTQAGSRQCVGNPNECP